MIQSSRAFDANDRFAEYRKSVAVVHENLLLFKGFLGPTVKDKPELGSVGERAARAAGVIVDAAGKLRCPPGTPNANQFTDMQMSNCLIPSAETAARDAASLAGKMIDGAKVILKSKNMRNGAKATALAALQVLDYLQMDGSGSLTESTLMSIMLLRAGGSQLVDFASDSLASRGKISEKRKKQLDAVSNKLKADGVADARNFLLVGLKRRKDKKQKQRDKDADDKAIAELVAQNPAPLDGLTNDSSVARGLSPSASVVQSPTTPRNTEILERAKAKGAEIDNDAKTQKLITDRLVLLDDKKFPKLSDYEREKVKLVAVSDYQRESIAFAVKQGKSDREILFDMTGSLDGKPDGADDFATRLTITRVIAEERGDTQLVADIDKFVADVESMDNAQFAAEYLEASKTFKSPLDQRSVVMTQAPHAVVESGRYKTVHEGSSSMGGRANRAAGGAEKIEAIRRNAEASRLGFDPNDTDAETASLRPSSSLTLSTHFAEDRAENLKKIHGNDVVIQHDYPTVSAAGLSKATRGDRKEKNSLVDGRAYGQASVILRPEVSERTLAVLGDSVGGDMNSPTSRLSTLKDNPEAAALFHTPQSVMFEARTGRTNTIASAAQNEDTGYYIEGMTVGSFETGDIQAIVTPLMDDRSGTGIASGYIEFGEPNDSAFGMNTSATVTALIGGARARDDYAEKHKIDVVLQSRFFDLNEVEPFNPTMTQGYIAQQMAKGAFDGVQVEELDITAATTPYEILLQVKKMQASRGGKVEGFLHPKNIRGTTPEVEAVNKANYIAMIDEELSRLSKKKLPKGVDL